MSAHPSASALWLHADGIPDVAVAAHVERCASCRVSLGEARALDALLTAPMPLAEEAHDRLLAIPDARRPVSWAAVAAAAVILLSGALALRSRPTPDDGVAVIPEVVSRHDQVIAALRDPTPAHRAFLEAEGDRVLVTLHRLARGLDPVDASAAIARMGVLARRASLPVLLDVVKREDRREAALIALGALGDPSAASAVAPWLEEPPLEPVARVALVRMGGEAAVAALVAHLDRVAKPGPLVSQIGRIPGAAAARALARLLTRPELAAAALAALDDARHLPDLLAAAREGSETALLALERLAPPAAVPTLRELLADRGRRGAAARALAAIDSPEAGAALLAGLGAAEVREAFSRAGPGIEGWLLARAERGDWRARRTAIDLLALCGSEAGIDTLYDLAADRGLAPHVVDSLGRIGGPNAVAALESLAERSSLKHAVVEALATTRSRAAVDALVRLGTTDRTLRCSTIAALGRIPHPEAVRAILALDGSRRTRRTTTHALRAMDRETVVPVLAAMLDGDRAAEARRWLDAVHTARP